MVIEFFDVAKLPEKSEETAEVTGEEKVDLTNAFSMDLSAYDLNDIIVPYGKKIVVTENPHKQEGVSDRVIKPLMNSGYVLIDESLYQMPEHFVLMFKTYIDHEKMRNDSIPIKFYYTRDDRNYSDSISLSFWVSSGQPKVCYKTTNGDVPFDKDAPGEVYWSDVAIEKKGDMLKVFCNGMFLGSEVVEGLKSTKKIELQFPVETFTTDLYIVPK